MTQPVRRFTLEYGADHYWFCEELGEETGETQVVYLATDYLALEADLLRANSNNTALYSSLERVIDERDAALAERDALRADARRYRWLRDHKCNSLHLTHDGDHACNYTTAKEWIEEFQPDWYADDSPQDIQQMKDANTIWCLQIYPNTPIGFNVWNSATLDAVVDRAVAEDDSALATQEAG